MGLASKQDVEKWNLSQEEALRRLPWDLSAFGSLVMGIPHAFWQFVYNIKVQYMESSSRLMRMFYLMNEHGFSSLLGLWETKNFVKDMGTKIAFFY